MCSGKESKQETKAKGSKTCMRHRRRSKEPKGDHSHSSRPAPPDGVEEDNEKSTEGDIEREREERERERTRRDGRGAYKWAVLKPRSFHLFPAPAPASQSNLNAFHILLPFFVIFLNANCRVQFNYFSLEKVQYFFMY
jgi:hypothetical protein